VTLAILAILAVSFGSQAMQRWSAPLGPGLGLPTLTPTRLIPTTELAGQPLAGKPLSSQPASLPGVTPTRRSTQVSLQTATAPQTPPPPPSPCAVAHR
jgi:hypothetical protein